MIIQSKRLSRVLKNSSGEIRKASRTPKSHPRQRGKVLDGLGQVLRRLPYVHSNKEDLHRKSSMATSAYRIYKEILAWLYSFVTTSPATHKETSLTMAM
jgi:hypothetical protein